MSYFILSVRKNLDHINIYFRLLSLMAGHRGCSKMQSILVQQEFLSREKIYDKMNEKRDPEIR